MSNKPITLLVTHPHPCSYLAEQEAMTAFVDPATDLDTELFTRLAEMGFRRSGAHVYRPQCAHCQACIAVRLPVATFIPNRAQKRCWQKNSDLSVRTIDNIDTDDIYALYERYLCERHEDGDMYPPTREQFRSFLCAPEPAPTWPGTVYLGIYQQDSLLGVAVCDRFTDGLSAVYTFFEPEEHARSLGVYAVLVEIERARTLQLDYLYLGYWIKDCAKMRYKISYRPIELLIKERWQRLA
jgi:arginyl-tRNA--protein-N-Asp/Glu arginylyltransferase